MIFLIAIDQFISTQTRATGASAADLSSPSDHFRSPRKGRLQRPCTLWAQNVSSGESWNVWHPSIDSVDACHCPSSSSLWLRAVFLRPQPSSAKLSRPYPIDDYRTRCPCRGLCDWVLFESSKGRCVITELPTLNERHVH